jgi:hypothetical protein
MRNQYFYRFSWETENKIPAPSKLAASLQAWQTKLKSGQLPYLLVQPSHVPIVFPLSVSYKLEATVLYK